MFEAVAVQGTEIVGEPWIAEQLFEDFPVTALGARAQRRGELPPEIRNDHAVVEKSVVDVEEEHDVRRRHGHVLRILYLCALRESGRLPVRSCRLENPPCRT